MSISKNKQDNTHIVLGIDVGSITSKAVVFSDNRIIGFSITPTVGNLTTVIKQVIANSLSKCGKSSGDVSYTIATGYGASGVPGANEVANDISCQGIGIVYLFPSVRTVVDIGGQFSRAFRVDSAGHVKSFVLSEKCAGGSGRLLQVIARVLHVDVRELGELSLKSKNRVDFTTGCAVFNESEAVSRIAEGESVEDIAAGVHRALAAKVQSLVERLGFQPEFAVVGGGAKNIGLVRSIEKAINARALVPEEPQIVAALGAALIARTKVSPE